MSDLSTVEAVVMTAAPGDIVVVTVPENWDMGRLEKIKRGFEQALDDQAIPDVKVVVGPMSVAVLRRGEADDEGLEPLVTE